MYWWTLRQNCAELNQTNLQRRQCAGGRACHIYIYHMYYIIMSTHTLLYVSLPHVKGFLMFLGMGPGDDSDESHTAQQCSIMKWLGAVVHYCPKPLHYGTVWGSSLSAPGPIPKNMRNPLTCGRPAYNRMCVDMII